MSRTVVAHIDLAALQHNLNVLRELAPQSKVLAVIKANGYGHGMVDIAQALEGAGGFGVACVAEARQLRQKGITVPILLLAGCFSQQELQESAQLGLDVVVHHLVQLEALERADLIQPLTVWLKIDTGMHRLGVSLDEVLAVYRRLQACSAVEQIKLMTHFACADEVARPETQRQIERFDEVSRELDCEQSLANSAGLVKFPHAQRQWVRPGIMIYGAVPFAGEVGADYGLKPVMTFTSHIMAIRSCKRGEAVGYGGAWVCPEDMLIGVVAVGYGDGYPRHASAGTPVLINGRRVSLLGRVSMDSIFIDLRSYPTATLGEEVVLWGKGLAVEEVAACANTIPYELLCKVTTRAKFIYR